MNTMTIDCTGSNLRPAPVPLDGSPTKRPLRSALIIILALGSLSMLAAFPGTASGQITAAKDCVTAPSNNLGSWTSTCTDTISAVGALTTASGCIPYTADLTSTSPVDTSASLNPQTICFHYKDAAKQYASGYAACSTPDNSQCGSSGITYSEAVELPDGSITLSTSALAIVEGSASSFVQVQLALDDTTEPPVSSVVLDISSNNSSVTISPATLTFSTTNYGTNQNISVTGVDDNDGDDESATITLTPATSSGLHLGNGTMSVTVTDDDGSIELSSAAVSAVEGGTDGTFTVKLGKAPTSSATLSVTSGDTSSATVSPATLTFSASNYDTTQTVTVTGVQDNDGTDDSATITVGVSSGYTASNQTKTITVEDDDGEIEVSSGAVTLTEGGAAGTFTVKLGAPPASSATLTVTSGDTGAVTVSPASLTFSASSYATAQTVTVTPVSDSDALDESVSITLAASAGYRASNASKTIAVEDDDGEIEVSAGAVTLTEGGSTGSFTVKLGSAPASSATITVTSADTGAVTVSPATLTFTSSNYDTAQTVTVTPVDDNDGTDESVVITVSATSGITLPDVTKTITVADDDGEIEVSSGAVSLTEGGAAGTFTVKLGAPPASSATITVTSGDTGAVTVSPASLTFSAASYATAQTVTVTPVDDSDPLDESVSITLAASAGYRASNASKTIAVDDDEPSPFDGTINVDLSEPIEVEEGETVTATITLSKAPTTDVNLTTTIIGTSPFEGLTLSASQFTTSNWDDGITLDIEAAEDSDYDDVTGRIRLEIEVSVGGRVQTLASRNITVAVEDDDTPPSGTIEISDSDNPLSITEGGSDGTFTVSLGGTAPTLDVVLSVTSADTGAVTVSPATLTFTSANSTTAQTVTVSPIDDEDSADESISVTLAVTSGTLSATEKIKTVTVVDDEDSSIDFGREGPLTISEGDSTTITVMLGGVVPTRDVTVNISKVNPDITIDTDPAVDGAQTTLTFTPQNSTAPQSVTIAAAQDSDETNDTDTITFTASGGIVATSTKSVTIIDDDTPRIVVRPAGTLVIDEGLTYEMTVNLSGNAPDTDATVTLTNTNSDITFDTNPDVAGNQTTLTFTAENSTIPQTVSVTSTVDSDSTDDTDTITLTATGGISATLTKSVDLRERPFTLSSYDALVIPEGASRVFSFRLAARPTGDVDVVVSRTNNDITVSPESFSFSPANWDSTRNVSVSVAEDDDPDNDTGAVILTASGSGLTGRTVTKAIEVDDNDDIRLSVDTLEVDEAGEATFTVRLWRRPSGSVNLNFANTNEDITVDVDPTVGGDQDILSFTTSNWDQRITVTVKAARDIDTIDDTDSIVITSQDVTGATLPVRVNDTTFSVIKSPVGSLRLTESTGETLYFALDKPPHVDQVQVRLSNQNEDITLNPRMLTFTSSNWQQGQSVRIFAHDDNDTDDDSDTVLVVATGIFDRRFEVSIADTDRELEEIPPAFILSPAERMVIVEGQPSYLHVRINGRPTSEIVVDVQRTNPRLSLRPPQISFGPSTWKDPVVVRIVAEPDTDTVSDTDTITLVADGFPDTRLAVEVVDETGAKWPIKTRALAFPPATVHDSATMRMRCNQDTPCAVHMDCKAQDGTPLSGEIPNPIPAWGTMTLTNAQLVEVIGGNWAGRGRLGCDLRSTSEISVQIWTRSGDGVLVNNSAFLRSAPQGAMHRADIESISSPGNSEKSNLRIRCLSEAGVRCHEMSLSCYDDEGNRYDGSLGSLLSGAVLHLQSESLADIIRYRWNDMSLACELSANQPFTVQVLTRTGGGGALVNNSATGSP